MLGQIFSSVFAWTLIAILAGLYRFTTKQRPIFPVVNDYRGDFFRRKAYREYNQNAKKLIVDGLAKHGSPITLRVPDGLKIVLPSDLSEWVKTNRDLDHQELIREEYFAGFPGFEAQSTLHAPDGMLINLLRTKLSQNEKIVPTVNRHIRPALQHYWGDSGIWHSIDWENDTTGIISRAAASIFVGPEKAADDEWQTVVQAYVREYFAAVSELHKWRAPLRPIVQWFLPHASACRHLLHQARAIMQEVVRKREQEAKDAENQGLVAPRYNDVLAWTMEVPGNKHPAGDIQLALAMAALFTTTELFKQILIDIARHPELVESLRKEIRTSLSEHGLGLTALAKMELLDSVMKESQRQIPVTVGLERKVIRDTSLPGGTRLPKGSHIMVDATDMWNPEVHENPEAFDGYRFLKRHYAGDKTCQFVQSSREHIVFGGGRHICPGRFFAGTELKLCLAHILLEYDIRLKEGYSSQPMVLGVYAIVDPRTQLEVRRREKTEDFVY
ncbi:cytochrome P450 [Aspergillus minisclerotigenes]|uniref:Dihydromonacolin L monooxygenase LovA n=1 Tax=Aspergillus minisclerotigenes TaxID=656917 RepID=A0A5N6JMZ0_9EURO|nr:cytochrome P450 [Aspergillus minisclerotigenes]